MRIHLDARGKVSKVEVLESAGDRRLDRAAVTEVQKWIYEPKLEDGQAVSSTIKVRVRFNLQ